MDLNGLLYHLETTLAKAFRVRGDASKNDLAVAKKFEEAAERKRMRSINSAGRLVPTGISTAILRENSARK